jgi:CheY-like chemotaxis protein
MNLSTTRHPDPLNILLVEDDDGDARAVERAFRKIKNANPIIRAVDGIEALEILKSPQGRAKLPDPRIVIVDLNMPRMDGTQFVKAIRDDDDLHHSIVFILTTSKRAEDKLAAYNLNVAGYIAKKTAGQDLLHLVNLLECYCRMVEVP